jgi:hypothetical protein
MKDRTCKEVSQVAGGINQEDEENVESVDNWDAEVMALLHG